MEAAYETGAVNASCPTANCGVFPVAMSWVAIVPEPRNVPLVRAL
jgi:hypothetical protein